MGVVQVVGEVVDGVVVVINSSNRLCNIRVLLLFIGVVLFPVVVVVALEDVFIIVQVSHWAG